MQQRAHVQFKNRGFEVGFGCVVQAARIRTESARLQRGAPLPIQQHVHQIGQGIAFDHDMQ